MNKLSKKLLKIKEASLFLGVSADTLRRWEVSGKITPIRTPGGTRLYSAKELNRIKELEHIEVATISEAAEHLGVSTKTLRRWDESGKLKALRNSQGERVYKLSELPVIENEELNLAESAVAPATQPEAALPQVTVEPITQVTAPEIILSTEEPALISEEVAKPLPEIQKEKLPFAGFIRSTNSDQLMQKESDRQVLQSESRWFVSDKPKPKKWPSLKRIATMAAIAFFLLAGIFVGYNQIGNGSPDNLKLVSTGFTNTQINVSNILGLTSAREGLLTINSDTLFNGDSTVNGILTAPNIIYGIIAGPNVTISEGQTPTISIANLVTGIQGQTGEITFAAGDDISITGLTIANTSTLASVTARGATTAENLSLSGEITLGNLLNMGQLATEPGTAVNGATYYNTSSSKFRCYINGSWSDCDTTGGGADGVGIQTIEEGDAAIVAAATTLDFLGGDFDVSESPSGEGNISLSSTLSSVTGVAGNFNVVGTLSVGSIALNSTGTNNTNSGAAQIGVFDEFNNSSSTTVQAVLNDLDAALGAGSSKWSQDTGFIYLTNTTDDVVIGGTDQTTNRFFFDNSASTLRLGATGNGVLQIGTLTLASDSVTDITGNGLQVSGGALGVNLLTVAADGASATTSSPSGLEFISGQLSLLQGCGDGQVIKWTESSDTWVCSNDSGATSAIVNVEEGTNPVGVNIDTLNFSTTADTDFDVTDSGSRATIDIDYTNFGSRLTPLNIGDALGGSSAGAAKRIDIGGVDTDLASTINIGTNNTTADVLTIGNSNAATTLALTGGDDWSIAATGVVTLSASASQTTAFVITDTDYTNALSVGDNNIIGTTAAIDFSNFDVSSGGSVTLAGDLAVNGQDITSTAQLNLTAVSYVEVGSGGTPTVATGATDLYIQGDAEVDGNFALGADSINDLTGTGITVTGNALTAVLGTSIDSSEIDADTITTADIAATLTFSSGDYLDLSAITHATTALQGLRLPNTSATPSNPTSGEGFIGYDATNNTIIYYDGTAWQTLTSTGTAGDITAVGDVTAGAAFDGTQGTTLYFEGATANGNEIALTSVDPGADFTITLPGITGTVALLEGTQTFTGAKTFSDLTVSDTNVAFSGASTTFTTTGAFTLTPGGAVTLGDGGDTLAIDTSDWDITATGAITNATYEGLTIGTTTGTFNLTNGKTLAVSNSLTLAGTDSTTITFQGTDTYVGRTTTDTLTNKTLTAPKFADLGFLADASGNEILVLDSVASAVNQLTITNAATGSGLSIAATGDDTDVALSIDAKGAGIINIGNTSTGNIVLGGGSGSTGCTLTNSSGAFACTGAITGSNISGTNTGDQTITLTGDVTGSGTGSFATTIAANAVTSGKILDNTITTSDLAATLTFADGDYIDLSAILHDDTALQGLRLPNTSATPSNPTSGEGQIAYDATNNLIEYYDGTAWQTLSPASTSGDITAVGDVTSGAAFDGTQGTTLYFEGATANGNEIALTSVDPGADFTITLPGITGTVALLEGTQTFSGAKTFSDLTVSDTNISFSGASTTFTTTGAFTLTPGGAVTIGDGGDTLAIDTSDWDITSSGAITNATYEGLTIGTTTGTFNLTNGKTLAVSNSLTLAGTDSTTITFQGTDTYVGRATTDTLTNKTLTAPRFADLGFLADSNGNEILVLDSAASAVNQLTITNSATTAGLSIAATGDDTDVALSIDAKAAGVINIGNNSTGNILLGGGSASTGCTLTNSSGAFACTGAITGSNLTGSSSGTNTGDQTITLTGDVTGSGTSSFATTIAANAVTSGKILDNTITATDLNATLTFADGDYLDLSAILHDDTALQGLRLPNTGASPSNPTSGEGFIAYDATNNIVKYYDGTSWVAISSGSGASKWTDGGATTYLTSTTDNIAVGGTDIGNSEFAIDIAGGGNVNISSITTTGNALAINAQSLSTGSALDVSSGSFGSASSTNTLARFTYSGPVADDHIEETIYALANTTGTNSTNIAGYFEATNGTNNYALVTAAGNVGIGDTSPSALLEVGDGTDSLQVSSVGDLTFVDANGGASITGPAGGALAINAGATGLNLQADGSINVNIGGGSGATGCTLTNSSGAFACTGAVTGSNLSGTNTGDQTITLTGDVTGSGTGSFATTIAANAVTSGKILDNTITASDLAATITFADGDYIDLSAIVHDDTALQGLRLPNTGASPSNPTSGEGQLAYDATGNRLIYYDGAAWVAVSAGSGASKWTDGGAITYLTATTDDLAVGGTGTTSPLFLDVSASALSLNPFGTSTGNTGEIRFTELAAGGTNYTGFKAPDALSADVVYTLPNAAAGGADQVLTWQSGNVLEWKSISGAGGGTGTVTSITAGTGLTATASNPITSSGTIAFDFSAALSGNHALAANEAKFGQSGLIFEGSTADNIEGYILIADPLSADKTWTFPDLTGTVALLENAQTFSGAKTFSAGLVVSAAQTISIGGDAIDEFAGNGLAVSSGDLAVSLYTPALDAASSTTSSPSGLEFVSSKLTLLQGCANDEILKWKESTDTWDCASDSGATSAVIAVQEGGTPVGTNIDTLNFDASDFSVTDVGSTDTITIDYTNFGTRTSPLNIGDASGSRTIDIGGVTNSGTDTINIATNGTAADTIAMGNSNASTTFALTGGDDWSISTAGAAVFATVDTGQGANELYDMNQNVLTTSSVTFDTLTLTNDLSVANGGTGASTLTANGVLFGNDASAIGATAAGTNGQLLLGVTSGAPAFATLSQDATITNAGVLTIASGAVTSGKILDNTITATDIAATLTFADGDYIDLSAILHDDTALQGLRLPNTSATPSNPTSGEGQIAYDATGNNIVFYDGSAWQTLTTTTTAGDITAVGDVTSGAAFDGTQGTTLYFEGATANGNEIALTSVDPGADFTITLPGITGTVALLEGTQTFTGTKTFDDLTIADTNVSLSGASTTFTSTGAFTLTPGGAVTLGDGGDTMAINTSDWDISATGAITNATYEGLTIGTTTGTFNLTNGKTLAVSNSLTLAGTDSTTITFQGTDTYVGRTTTDTLTNKTLTAPRFADNGFLADSNGNEMLILDSAASAVNQLTITNSATTAGLSIAATGDDTDVALSIDAKGAGVINIGNTSTGNLVLGGGSGSTGCTLTNSSGAFACTGAITGSNLSGSNTGDQTITLTGDVTGSGTGSFATTIAANAVTTGKILDNTITASDLAATLTFADADYIDLSAILHDDTALQGLRLPNTSATPSNPTSGEGFIAYDATNNLIEYYDGAAWQTLTPTATAGDITAVGDVTSGAAFDGTQGTTLYFEGATANGNEIALTSVDPGADFTITLPGITGTVALLEGTQTFTGAKTFSDLTVSDTNIAFSGASATFTTTGAFTLTPGGAVTLGDGGDTMAIDTSDWDITATGAITNATYEGLTIGTTTGTFNLTNGKTLAVSNSLTLAGTDATTITFQGTDTYVGRTTTDTLTNKTLTAPKFADLGFLADANGNEILVLDSAASAVNQLTITNSATTAGLSIAATGDDTDVALSIDAKGAGVMNIGNNSTGNILLGGGSASTGCTLTNSSGAFACTGAITGSNLTGSSSGTNTGDQTITLTGDVTGSGTGSFATTIAANAVTSGKILDNTITTSDLAATLTFADGDYIDLSAILHDDTALQGLRLPNTSATPSNPTSGEGQIAYDATNNLIEYYDGAAWQTLTPTATAGDITAVGDVTSGDAFTGTQGTTLYFEGATANGNEIALTSVDPGADFTITLPGITGTVALLEGTQTFTGAKTFSDLTISDTDIALSGASTTLTSTGAFTLTPGGAVTLGDGGDTMAINTSDWDISATGAITNATYEGLTIGTTTGTFNLTNGKTLAVSNSLTLAGTDSTTITFQGTDTYVGRATTDTLTNKTLTAPKFADLGFLADANGNEILVLDSAASAVNQLTITNSATTAGLSIAATGDDTDVALSIDAKGAGVMNIGNNSTGNILLGGGSASTGCTVTNSSGAFACTGAVTGSNLSGTNTGDQTITLTGDVTGSGTGSFATTIAANAVTTGKILDNTITTSDLAATLTFADGDYIDLSAILHDDTALQGLRLPNTSATPSNPTSGEGQIAYDATNNLIEYYDGAAWQTLTSTAASGDITAVGDVTSGAAFDGTQGTTLYFEGATANGNEIALTSVDPGADFTITLPGITGTVALLEGTQTFSGAKTFSDLTISDTDIALSGASTTLTSTGAFTLTPGGAVTLGDGGDTMVINTSDWDISATGAITNATYEGLTIGTTTGTFNLTNGKTFAVSNSLTLAGTDSTTITFQGTDTYVGRATTDTLTNKTLTAPKFADLGFLADASGNEILVLDSAASAVNQLTITNSATTAGLSIAATGDDTDVALSIDAKAAGVINIGNNSTGNILLGGGSASTGCTITNSTGDLACSGTITSNGTTLNSYWSRASTTLSPTTSGDNISIVGATNDITTGTNEALTLAPNGSGDILLPIDADTNVQLTASAAPGADMLSITNSGFGTTTNGVDGIALTLVAASGTTTNSGINLTVTGSGDSGDTMRGINIGSAGVADGTLYGLNVAGITGGNGAETAVNLGSGWDTAVALSSISSGSSARGIMITDTSIDSGKAIEVASTSDAYTTGSLFTASLTQAAATGTSVSGDIANLSQSPTYSTAVTTPAITGNVLDLSRTSTTNSSFVSTLTVSGPILNVTNTATQTTGTLTDSASLVKITQDADATGALLNLVSNRSSTGTAFLVEQTASGTQALKLTDAGNLTINGDFTVSGGDINGPAAAALLITAPSTALNLQADGSVDVNIGGGSGATGCTLTNSSGAFACTGAVTGSNLSGTNTGDQTITLTGDVTGSGTGSFATTIAANAVTSGKILDNTITAADLNATLTFADADYIDLSAILHDDTALQGLRLPNTGATPSNPTSGEGQIAYDTVGDVVKYYNGSAWVTLQGTSGVGDITAVGSMTTGAAFADSSADDDWLGLGASAGRIGFDDLGTDEIDIFDATLDLNTNLIVNIGAASTDFTAGGGLTLAETLTVNDDVDLVFAAGENLNIDAETADNTTTAGVLHLGVDTATTDNLGLYVDYQDTNTGASKTMYASRISAVIDANATGDDTVYAQQILMTQNDAAATAIGIAVSGEDYSYFSGNVGIGDTSPSSQLEVGNGTDSLQVSSVGDLTFVDADGGASITGPAGGALAINAGATGLNLQADGSIDVNIAGGSGATGCTVTNSSGNLNCSGTITSNGTALNSYWTRTSTNLSPTTAGDDIVLTDLDFIGLSSSAGRIVFDDAGTDEIDIQTANLDLNSNLITDIGATGTDFTTGGGLTLAEKLTVNDEALYTFAAGEQIIIDGESTPNTTTNGVLRLSASSATDSNTGFLLNYIDSNASTSKTLYASQILTTINANATGDDTVIGQHLLAVQTDAAATAYGIYSEGEDYDYFAGSVGIGDSSPDAKLEVLSTTEQMRLTYTDGSVDSRFTVDSSGNLTINNTGTKTVLSDDLEVAGTTGLTFTGSGADLVFTNGETINNDVNGTIAFTANTDGTDTYLSASLINGTGSDDYGILNLATKTTTGSPATCTVGDIYVNSEATVTAIYACTSTNNWEQLDGAGNSTTLQQSYDADADGSDATITLSAADDGIIFTNPTSGGNDSTAYLFKLNQANTTAGVSALDIVQASNAFDAVNLTANAIDSEIALDISATGLTTGIGVNVALTEATLNGGYYFRGYDNTAAAAVFSVGEDGNTTITGLEGSNMLTLTTGDAVVSDGSLSITDDDNDAASFSLINNTATTTGASANTNTLGIADFSSTSLTTGNLMNLDTATANTLTTGSLLNIGTSATSMTSGNLVNIFSDAINTSSFTGQLVNIDWSPSGALTTLPSADLFRINIGSNGTTTGNLLDIEDAGSSIFSVSETAVTSAIPASFTAPGDVAVAYDLNFTNPTASYIKSAAPLYLSAGETFNSSNLTLQTYNSGSVVFDAAGGLNSEQAQNWTLSSTASTAALNIQSSAGTSLLDLDTTNSRVGIGTNAPARALHVTGSILRFGDNTAVATLTTAGDFAIGSIGTATNNGRIWVYSNGKQFRFTSVNSIADYSEFFYQGEESSEAGDVMVIDETNPSPVADTGKVTKSSGAYQDNVIGVISTLGTGYNNNDDNHPRNDDPHFANVGMLGHIPTKVSDENGPIERGDFLTPSSTPGVSMKATQAGIVIGKALEPYSGSGVGKILTMVNVSYADPEKVMENLSLDADGTLVVPSLKIGSIKLDDQLLGAIEENGQLSYNLTQVGDRVGQAEIGLASLTNRVDQIENTVTQQTQVNTSQSAALTDLNAQLEQVASESAQTALELDSKLASQSGELADLKTRLEELHLTPPSEMLATGSATLTNLMVTSEATFSGKLIAYESIVSDTFKSLGDTFLGKTSISGDLNIDGTFSVSNNAINVIGTPVNPGETPTDGILYIQNSPLSNLVDFFNGAITIDRSGSLNAREVVADQIKINTGKSAGSGVITAGTTQLVLPNTLVQANSIIIITPETTTTSVLAVTAKAVGNSFTVSIPTPTAYNIPFSYLIVGQSP